MLVLLLYSYILIITVEQVLYSVQSHHSKHKLLMHLIENDQSLSSAVQSGKCVVVFTRTAGRAEAVARLLREGGYRASHIHSALPLPQKRRLLDSLRSEETNNIQFIVSPTDFLGRGVDVPTLSHVINYDVPIEPEQYLHSVGRCGRMKRPGTAITLVAREPAMVRLFDGRQKTQLDEKRLIDNIEAFLQRYDKTKETKRSFMPNFREIPSGFQEVHEDELSNREQSKNYEPIDKLPYYEQVLAEAKRKVATKRGIQIK